MKVEHWLTPYGDTPTFKGEGVLKDVQPIINPTPLAITYFKKESGEDVISIVNLSQKTPTAFIPKFEGDFAKYNFTLRLAPGQMVIFSKEAVCPEQ